MLDEKLLKAINSNRCFLLVGAGPSCEIGYPSWEGLAKKLYGRIKQLNMVSDEESYEKYLGARKYPEFFKLAESDIGGRTELVGALAEFMKPPTSDTGYIYQKLTEWPFACYLTTNYDDEIKRHLDETGVHYEVLRNQKDDFHHIRDGVSELIFKLHSELDHPHEAVITSADYQRFYIDDNGQYFRDKLRMIFEMFDVLIIGHSLSDPDINYILQVAKKNANPNRPIYMIAADYTKAEETEYLEKYNIVLLPYSNPDGKHAKLRRLLSTYDRFIFSRGRQLSRSDVEHVEVNNTALSLFLYRKLQGANTSRNFSSLILFALQSSSNVWLSIKELLGKPPLDTLTNGSLESIVEDELGLLHNELLLEEKGGRYRLTPKGAEQVENCYSTRDVESRQAYGQFSSDLKKAFIGLTNEQEDFCKELAEKTIVSTFQKRSLTIAKKVFANQSSSSNELTDIFGQITSFALTLEDIDLRLAFVDAMHDFIISPTDTQSSYLASVSQGFFLYHLLGLDPACSKLRKDIVEKTFWLLDSNVLLPLLAVGCHNHDYAKDLMRMLKEASTNLYTTDNLLKEVDQHFQWADYQIKNQISNPTQFMQAVLSKGSYSQNLFLDGYVKLCADGAIGTYKDYLELIFPESIQHGSFRKQLEQYGISSIHPSDVDGFENSDWGEIEQAKIELRDARKDNATYKSELQVSSEAEIKILVENLRSGKYKLPEDPLIEKVYFVSQSRILDRVFNNDTIVTWVPEAVYRYLSSLPDQNTNPDLLQKCMLNEYYYAGVSFIDKDAYMRFFGSTIDEAKLSYQQEKEKYVTNVENTSIEELDEDFDNTPDLEKPFFVTQMAWKVADSLKQNAEIADQRAKAIADDLKQNVVIANQRANVAENKLRILEAENDKSQKARDRRKAEQETGRLRNLQDPKHLRKRERQAKQRKKKK